MELAATAATRPESWRVVATVSAWSAAPPGSLDGSGGDGARRADVVSQRRRASETPQSQRE